MFPDIGETALKNFIDGNQHINQQTDIGCKHLKPLLKTYLFGC